MESDIQISKDISYTIYSSAVNAIKTQLKVPFSFLLLCLYSTRVAIIDSSLCMGAIKTQSKSRNVPIRGHLVPKFLVERFGCLELCLNIII